MRVTVALALALLAACLAPAALGFEGLPQMPGIPGSDKPKVYANKKDLKYIRCQVCELLAKNAYKQVKRMRKEATPSKPVTERAVIEMVEKLSKPLKDEGEWIMKIDLVEEGDKLVAKEMDELGECGVECKTVERAAQDILDEHDTDMGEVLYLGKKSRAQFSNWLCYELTSSCKTKPPPLPKNRKPGPPFKPADLKQLSTEKFMAGLGEAGLHGNMYSRDEAINKFIEESTVGASEDDDDMRVPGHTVRGVEEDDDDEDADEEHPLNRLASGAMEKGQELLSKAKDAAGGLVEGANAGLQKAREEAQRLWDSFQKKDEEGGSKKSGHEAAAAEL